MIDLVASGWQSLVQRPPDWRNLGQKARVNKKWKHSMRDGQRLFIPKQPLLKPGSKIFCMGSCFALEIKDVLKSLGYTIHPSEANLPAEEIQKDPNRNWSRVLVHYNTFTILQEIEKAFGLWEQDAEDYWFVKRQRKGKAPQDLFQDPYRRESFSKTKQGILESTGAFDQIIRRGVMESDLYIFTLGLTEVWRKKDNGRYACANPGYGGGAGFNETDFAQSTFEENYANVKRFVALVHSRFPQRQIVLSVSPVALGQTFSDNDVYIANTESKSILRAVAGRVARECANVHYFPAFELCALYEKYGKGKTYQKDGRHVTNEAVTFVIETFIEKYSERKR